MTDAGGNLKVIRWLVAVRVRILGHSYEDVAPDVLAVTGSAGRRHTVSLTPLARAATALPRAEWPAAVDEFLTAVLGTDDPGEEALDTVLPLLRTKLVPEEATRRGSAVHDDFGPDLVEGLVIDRALAMEWVTTDRVSSWSADGYELLRRGRENVRAAGRLDVGTTDVDGTTVTLLSGNDYASTHLFWLADYGLAGEHGALVSVPERTTVLVTPIVAGTSGFDHLQAMVELTMAIYRDADHPIVPRIYHWEEDVMREFGRVNSAALLQEDGRRLLVIVDPSFQQAQQALTG